MNPSSNVAEPPVSPAPVASGLPAGSRLVIALLGMSLALGGSLVLWVGYGEKPENLIKRGSSRLPVLGEMPDFEFESAAGGTVSRDSLLGRVWIANFVFTSCGGTCPVMSQNMSALSSELGRDPAAREAVRYVSFTVDPERDTPQALSSYAERFEADADRWFFARSTYEATQSFAREAFRLMVDKNAEDGVEPIVHSQSFVLIDAEGRIRGYYDGTNGAATKGLVADAKALVHERGEAAEKSR